MWKKQTQSFLPASSLQIDPVVREVSFLQTTMVQFEEVLGCVRLALTWATPAEVQALLEGLVEQEIISEAYSRSLSLHRLTEGIAPNCIHNEPPCGPGAIQDHSLEHVESVLLLDESWTYGCQVTDGYVQEGGWEEVKDEDYFSHGIRSTPSVCDTQSSLDDEMPELLRSAHPMQKPASDSERAEKGISADEREWLEQVEEAARRLAVPLWQHWDRGREMLLPMLPSALTDCRTIENSATHAGEQCSLLKMEEETELAVACRSLGLYIDNFREVNADVCFSLDAAEATRTPEDLCFCPGGSAALPGLDADPLSVFGRAGSLSPVEDCMATNTSSNLADRQEDPLPAAEDLINWSTDDGFAEVAGLLSPSTLKDTFTLAPESLFSATTHHSVTSDFTESIENVFPSVFGTTLSSTDALPASPDGTEHEERLESHWGAKMQEEDQDPLLPTEYGDLPDDISEFMNDKYLLEPDGLFEELFNCDDLDIFSDVCVPELPILSRQQREDNKPAGNTNKRRNRRKAAPSHQCSDDVTPPKPKRHRPTGQSKPTETQTEHVVTHNAEAEPDLSPVKTPGLTTPPPRIIHVSPPIQFIIPDTSGWISPQVIRLPFPRSASAPTYILVPASPPPCKPQVPPLSPVDGAVAPVHMSSSPQGSATASKAISPPPLSPNNDISPCKESPQSPSVLDLPQAAKDYIQDSKAHMGQTCQDIEDGLSLASHYVDRQVSQKEILRSGKNTIKCLDKELVIMGETDRHKSLISQSQIFDGLNGDKPKRYIFLFGNAGMGKTTLIRKLCLDWSNDCLPQFDFVFLLDGKAPTLTEATHSLQTLLLNLSTFAAPCVDADAVYAQILAAPKRVLIVFDGFDELRDYEILLQNQEKDLVSSLQKDSKAPSFTVRQLYAAILQRVLLPGCTLLLSSRPKGTASQILRRADSFLEVCGFTPTDVETYLWQYFTDAALRASALDCLKDCSYLHLLCWNPGLCRLVCFVLEHSKGSGDLPRTLTGLCHQVLRLKIEKDCGSTASSSGGEEPEQSAEETKGQISTNTPKRSRAHVHTRSRTQKARRTKKQKDGEVAEGETKTPGSELDRKKEKELLVQLSSLAWEGVKANSSVLPKGRTVSDQLRAFGIRMGLLLSRRLGTETAVSSGEKEEKTEPGGKKEGIALPKSTGARDEHILLWANPFLQSYLAGARLSLSRSVSERSFLQTLPFQAGPKGRRRPQREEHELTQRFAVGLLFHKKSELQWLHSYAETVKDTLVNKQGLVRKHLHSLSLEDLSPAQVLDLCHYVYEASFTHADDRGDSSRLLADLAAKLPEAQTFSGVPLNPPDVFAVQKVLERGGSEGRRFCLDLENSGIHVSGLRALVGLSNISTYRACIADVISLWEQLEQSGDDGLLQGAFSKFKIHPLKATQVCHVEHLAKLVNIHRQRRLSDSSSQSHPILAEGVPAVRELHTLEYELDPDKGPLGLPKLWELLPGLQNLQHLDLENGNIGDKGAEQLADALASHSSLEILNLSQNSIGDHGVKKLASTVKDLPKLHCLSLYSNVISDEGAESLAAVLPHMSSLTVLDVLYNKLTDVGAQVLAACLKNCKRIKHLRMWNQFIPYGVLERLHKQDNRILHEAT